MIVGMRELLVEARSRGGAVGAFTAYNLETAIGVARAAEANAVGAIVLISTASLRTDWAPLFLAGVVAAVRESPAPLCVQLDHVGELELVELALEAGAGAIMADGSRLPFEENAALVRAVGELARPAGAQVEAELGHIEGDEDVAAAAEAGALTDPADVPGFLAATGADCLAVSIGNVHGAYASPPRLDWTRLDALAAASAVPLSLHGASGLPDADLVRAVRAGVAKVNVNTDLRAGWFATLERAVPALADGLRVGALDVALVECATEVAGAKMRLLAGAREIAS